MKWLIPLKRFLKYPEHWNDPWKNLKKSPQTLLFSLKWLLWWPYLQFWCLNFCQWWAIIIMVYCFTHLFFQFSSVCVHRCKQSLSKGFKGTWKTINWHRNCPGGCQYQLLNCWYMSIGQWICVITEWLSIQVIFCQFIIKICIVLGVHSLCVALGEDQEYYFWE